MYQREQHAFTGIEFSQLSVVLSITSWHFRPERNRPSRRLLAYRYFGCFG